jgi:hypothetical protein
LESAWVMNQGWNYNANIIINVNLRQNIAEDPKWLEHSIVRVDLRSCVINYEIFEILSFSLVVDYSVKR